MTEFSTVSVQRLAELGEESGVDLIDVRTPVEFRETRASIARNVPLDSLDPDTVMEERNGTRRDPLYLICRTGSRSGLACQKFLEAGYSNVLSVDGGVEAWEAAGFPVVRGKKAVSLERQVRIAAGSLVLLGIGLGIFVHPYFVGLSMFVGAGLVFSGLTDTCGMGMVLARMPWNQVTASDESCCSQ